MKLRRSSFFYPHQQLRQVDIHLLLHRERELLLIITKKYHALSLSLLSPNGNIYSYARAFLVGTIPVPLTWKVYSFLYVFGRFNRGVQSPVSKNPYHIGAFIEISCVNVQNSPSAKTLPIKASPQITSPTVMIPPKKTSQTAALTEASKGKKIITKGTNLVNLVMPSFRQATKTLLWHTFTALNTPRMYAKHQYSTWVRNRSIVVIYILTEKSTST